MEDFLTPERVVQLGREPNRIDLLTSISGVSFEEAWPARVEGQIDGLPAHIIGRDALLRNKESSGRAKDRIDHQELRKQEEK